MHLGGNCFVLGSPPQNTHILLLGLLSEITPGGLEGPYGILMEPRLAVCKANAIAAVLLPWPQEGSILMRLFYFYSLEVAKYKTLDIYNSFKFTCIIN